MTLPRPILLRILRAIRRQLMIPAGPHSLNRLGWAGGPSDPDPEPPNRMKLSRFILLAAVFVLVIGLLVGCVQTTTTAKDGSVTVTKAPAPGVLQFAGAAITAYSPRPIKVREEKSGRISREEIQKRWKPTTP